MKVYINSTLREIPDSVNTVGKLIDHLRMPRTGTGIGINNALVPAKNWDTTQLQQEDRILIISAAYGG